MGGLLGNLITVHDAIAAYWSNITVRTTPSRFEGFRNTSSDDLLHIWRDIIELTTRGIDFGCKTTEEVCISEVWWERYSF